MAMNLTFHHTCSVFCTHDWSRAQRAFCLKVVSLRHVRRRGGWGFKPPSLSSKNFSCGGWVLGGNPPPPLYGAQRLCLFFFGGGLVREVGDVRWVPLLHVTQVTQKKLGREIHVSVGVLPPIQLFRRGTASIMQC